MNYLIAIKKNQTREGDMKFREYRPGYISGFDNKEYSVNSLKDIFEIEFVKNFSKSPNFHCFAVSVGTTYNDRKSPDKLMALYDFNKELGKCSEWWVIGYLENSPEIDLPKYETMIYRKL